MKQHPNILVVHVHGAKVKWRHECGARWYGGKIQGQPPPKWPWREAHIWSRSSQGIRSGGKAGSASEDRNYKSQPTRCQSGIHQSMKGIFNKDFPLCHDL
jgi:hypothetical protein